MKPALIVSAHPSRFDAFWQRIEHVEVDHYPGGMPKRPDQVLAGQIQTGLATHRRVHRSEQCGGHIGGFDPTQPRGRDEPGQIGDGPTADAHDRVEATDFVVSHPFVNRCGHLPCLAEVTVREFEPVHLEAIRGQIAPNPLGNHGGGTRLVEQRHPLPIRPIG